jgi:RNA polymerase sigma-70 factor (ECF subfamily)
MAETSVSLLQRLQERPDPESWQRLVDLYTPLLRQWLRRQAVADADADDLAQDVLAVVVRRLPDFRHNQRPGAFRHWLRTILAHRLGDHWRAQKSRPVATGDSDFQRQLEQLEDPASALSQLWDQEHDRHVVHRLLELLEPHFEPATLRAFQRLVRDGARAAEVAAELGISVNAVLLAKSRVLRRLRQEARGLTD